MKYIVVVVLSELALVALAAANELLVNGSFEQGINVGWTSAKLDLAGSSSFECADSLRQPFSLHAARVRKDLASYAVLQQTVSVPNANLAFSFDGRFRMGGGSSTCWPAAAMILRYQNTVGLELGNTKFVLHNEYCTWSNSDTAHLVEINNPEVWRSYTLNVAQEIATNLPGVTRANVAKVLIQIYAYDNGT